MQTYLQRKNAVKNGLMLAWLKNLVAEEGSPQVARSFKTSQKTIEEALKGESFSSTIWRGVSAKMGAALDEAVDSALESRVGEESAVEVRKAAAREREALDAETGARAEEAGASADHSVSLLEAQTAAQSARAAQGEVQRARSDVESASSALEAAEREKQFRERAVSEESSRSKGLRGRIAEIKATVPDSADSRREISRMESQLLKSQTSEEMFRRQLEEAKLQAQENENQKIQAERSLRQAEAKAQEAEALSRAARDAAAEREKERDEAQAKLLEAESNAEREKSLRRQAEEKFAKQSEKLLESESEKALVMAEAEAHLTKIRLGEQTIATIAGERDKNWETIQSLESQMQAQSAQSEFERKQMREKMESVAEDLTQSREREERAAQRARKTEEDRDAALAKIKSDEAERELQETAWNAEIERGKNELEEARRRAEEVRQEWESVSKIAEAEKGRREKAEGELRDAREGLDAARAAMQAAQTKGESARAEAEEAFQRSEEEYASRLEAAQTETNLEKSRSERARAAMEEAQSRASEAEEELRRKNEESKRAGEEAKLVAAENRMALERMERESANANENLEREKEKTLDLQSRLRSAEAAAKEAARESREKMESSRAVSAQSNARVKELEEELERERRLRQEAVSAARMAAKENEELAISVASTRETKLRDISKKSNKELNGYLRAWLESFTNDELCVELGVSSNSVRRMRTAMKAGEPVSASMRERGLMSLFGLSEKRWEELSEVWRERCGSLKTLVWEDGAAVSVPLENSVSVDDLESADFAPGSLFGDGEAAVLIPFAPPPPPDVSGSSFAESAEFVGELEVLAGAKTFDDEEVEGLSEEGGVEIVPAPAARNPLVVYATARVEDDAEVWGEGSDEFRAVARWRSLRWLQSVYSEEPEMLRSSEYERKALETEVRMIQDLGLTLPPHEGTPWPNALKNDLLSSRRKALIRASSESESEAKRRGRARLKERLARKGREALKGVVRLFSANGSKREAFAENGTAPVGKSDRAAALANSRRVVYDPLPWPDSDPSEWENLSGFWRSEWEAAAASRNGASRAVSRSNGNGASKKAGDDERSAQLSDVVVVEPSAPGALNGAMEPVVANGAAAPPGEGIDYWGFDEEAAEEEASGRVA